MTAAGRWTFPFDSEAAGRVHRHRPLRERQPATWSELLDALVSDEQCRLGLTRQIVDAPFSEVFFEWPALSPRRLGLPAEFVLVQADLRSAPDPRAFRDHLDRDKLDGERLVVTFANLGGDATLVVPSPADDGAVRNYLRSFLRTAPHAQIHAFWIAAAEAVRRRVDRVPGSPVWVSTSGGGVPWVHLRLDDRPKYYTFAEYRSLD